MTSKGIESIYSMKIEWREKKDVLSNKLFRVSKVHLFVTKHLYGKWTTHCFERKNFGFGITVLEKLFSIFHAFLS